MKQYLKAIVILCLHISIVTLPMVNAVKLKQKFKWREVEFDWPSQEAKQEAIRTGKYVTANNLPLGLERWKEKLFITVPRYDYSIILSYSFLFCNQYNLRIILG